MSFIPRIFGRGAQPAQAAQNQIREEYLTSQKIKAFALLILGNLASFALLPFPLSLIGATIVTVSAFNMLGRIGQIRRHNIPINVVPRHVWYTPYFYRPPIWHSHIHHQPATFFWNRFWAPRRAPVGTGQQSYVARAPIQSRPARRAPVGNNRPTNRRRRPAPVPPRAAAPQTSFASHVQDGWRSFAGSFGGGAPRRSSGRARVGSRR